MEDSANLVITQFCVYVFCIVEPQVKIKKIDPAAENAGL